MLEIPTRLEHTFNIALKCLCNLYNIILYIIILYYLPGTFWEFSYMVLQLFRKCAFGAIILDWRKMTENRRGLFSDIHWSEHKLLATVTVKIRINFESVNDFLNQTFRKLWKKKGSYNNRRTRLRHKIFCSIFFEQQCIR